MFDTIIVGAGAAGAHFAYQSAKRGYSTLLVESKPPWRYKCCAGGISNRFLHRYHLPSKVIEREITGFSMMSPDGGKGEIDLNRGAGVTVIERSLTNGYLNVRRMPMPRWPQGWRPKPSNF